MFLFCQQRSIVFSINSKLNIVDAIWHVRHNDDCVLCLTNDYNMRFFKVKNPKIQMKEFHLASVFSQSNLDQMASEVTNKGCKLVSIDMGSKFEYNEKLAYPIYILKINGQVDCLIEYDT